MTREFKGTPGPWVSVDYCGKLQIQAGKYYEDADILDKEDVGEEVAEANASLIEVAPDMFSHFTKLTAFVSKLPVTDETNDLVAESLVLIHKALGND